MATWDELREAVENNGNINTFTMDFLRDAHGSARLGVHVLAEINNALAGMGMGHVPKELPTYQHEQVRVYKRGTPIGDVIETVLAPGEGNDKKLIDKFSEAQPKHGEIIEQIRQLVAE